MKSKLFPILIFGLLLRFFFMSFFYHPDLKSQYFHGQFLSQGVLNIYSYIPAHLQSLPYRDTFNYPPLAYLTLGSWESMARLITGPGLVGWLNDWSGKSVFNSNIPIFIFWLKLPYLVADILFCYLLLASVPQKRRELAAYLWAFNPVSIYAVFMVGQFDILPSLLTFIAYILLNKRKIVLSVLFVSLAVAFKTYPIFLLPFIIFRSQNMKHFFIAALSFIFVFAIWVLPFARTPEFLASVFQSPLGQRLFIAGIDIGFGERLPIFFIIYSIALGFSWLHRQRIDLLPEFLFTTSAILAIGHFHAQWAVWSLPFWLVYLVRFPGNMVIFFIAVFFYFCTIFLLPDQYVLVGMFTPLNPNLITIPPLTDLLKNSSSPLFLQSVFHAFLSGLLSLLVFQSWRETHET